MTKTFNDIEAVSQLLEEKERDLELAAQIGQSLLENNKCLNEKNNEQEELILQANERINQLRHDLMIKDELLQLYVQNYDSTDACLPDSSEKLMMPELQKKVKILEEENEHLHLETSNLKLVIDGLEDIEQKLVHDCAQQTADLRHRLDRVAKELTEKTEECSWHKDEITQLLCQIDTLKKQICSLTTENMEYKKMLEACDDTQNCLETEIAELTGANEEIRLELAKAQEELRYLLRTERLTHAALHSPKSFLCVQGESLASELETSRHRDEDYPNGYSPEERRQHTRKVFGTAKAVNNHLVGSLYSASMLETSELENAESKSVLPGNSWYYSDTESGVSERLGRNIDSLYGGSTSRLGMPGIPGSSDLQNALHRLTLRQDGERNEHEYVPEENTARQELEIRIPHQTVGDVTDVSDTECHTHMRCHSLDSMLSANSGYVSMAGSSGNPCYPMPKRLKIIKPLEGSGTLKRWQDLAKPHMGVIFESSPGVHSKGEHTNDIMQEMYNFSDFEEDDDISMCPGRYQESCNVYARTESTVRHPRVTMPSFTTSTPRMTFSDCFSHRQGTHAHSTLPGLALVYNEQDVVQTTPKGATVAVRSVHGCSPSRCPCSVNETNTTIIEGPTSSASPPSPTNVYQQIPPPTSTLPQRSDRNPESGLLTDIPLPGERTSVGTRSSESADFSQNDKPFCKKPTAVKVESNVIRNLKEKGASLFGYLMNSRGAYNSGSATKVSQPCAIMFSTTSTTSVSNVMTFVSSTDSIVTTAINTDTITTVSATLSEMPKRSHLASILLSKSVGDVIGAFSKLTRDGAL